jgi:Fe-S oxidoreductase
MGRYKSEVLHRTYRRRRRPASHYSVGWLPRWISMIDAVPRVGPGAANTALRLGPLRRLLLRAGGLDSRRTAPRFASVPFRRWWRRNGPQPARGVPVLLWADSFTDGMDPEVAIAAARVLTDAGYRVAVPERQACCGLSWITTGQLDGARRRLRRLLDILGPVAAQGLPIVGLEPSCVAALRSDLVDLLPDDPRAAQVAAAVRTLAELLTAAPAGTRWTPPDLQGVEILVQPHCHHHSVMGFAADRLLLSRTGARVTELAGCCGLAGNFGMERGHYETSVAVAETSFLPALRSRSASTVVLADGFSCRTQAQQLAGVRPIHLAELLASTGSPGADRAGSLRGGD